MGEFCPFGGIACPMDLQGRLGQVGRAGRVERFCSFPRCSPCPRRSAHLKSIETASVPACKNRVSLQAHTPPMPNRRLPLLCHSARIIHHC